MNKEKLQRGLSNRHIQLIALGGSIGTGLFLGIGPAAILAGPSVIVGYAICGFISFLVMRQLGEMVAQEPTSGSFSYFANKYWGPFAGFASGWNYWILNTIVSMTELTAVGVYIHFWWPEIPLWASSLFFFMIINMLNLSSVKVFGEAEFLFAIIKVVAIIAMIIFGCYLLLSGTGGEQATIKNLWDNGGFFPKGILCVNENGNYEGLISAMAIIMFAFGGLELIGITAAEAKNPRKSIPKATNQVIYRILIFYIGSIIVLFSLSPWESITADSSPFVTVFNNLNGLDFNFLGAHFKFSKLLSNTLNVIVLTAALSVYNSTTFCTSRMLFGLSEQGNAPKLLKRVNKNQVPVNAIIISSLITAVSIIINKFLPESALKILISLTISTLVINWAMISLTHLKYKQRQKDIKPFFPSLFFPISNYLCLAFFLFILVVMWITDMSLSVKLIPIWLITLWISYLIIEKYKK